MTDSQRQLDKDLKFRDWMKKVDHAIQKRTGLVSDDLPDCCYRDWFDDGVTPSNAASHAIRAANS